MSLINDALKKAQKQRSGEAPPLASMPAIGGESATRIAKRAKPAGFNALLLRLGIGLAVLVVLIAGLVIFLRHKPAANPPSASSEVAASPKPAEPTKPAAMAAPAPTSFVVPIPPPTKSAETPAVKVPAVATVPKETPKAAAVASAPAVETPKPPAAPVKLEPRAIAFIENLRVAGIRASATDSKVLMNDRVYRINDTVEHELGLKLVGITASSLTFEDERGGRYTRNF